ncbi:AAA family ATPase, partial [Cribrihabitans sp. XS_ASV171]
MWNGKDPEGPWVATVGRTYVDERDPTYKGELIRAYGRWVDPDDGSVFYSELEVKLATGGTGTITSAHAREAQAGKRLPTEFVWRDPATIPPRPWVYGRHLIRKQASVTVAPGGVGKSSLTICEGLAMASGRELLDDWTAQGLKVWIYNLEDPRDELERRIIAAMQHHNVTPDEIAGRLFVDTGRERELCTAMQTREGVEILRPEIDALAREIRERQVDVLIIDPFVSSHQVGENDNGAIDLVAKEWARLADRCNCAIELV